MTFGKRTVHTVDHRTDYDILSNERLDHIPVRPPTGHGKKIYAEDRTKSREFNIVSNCYVENHEKKAKYDQQRMKRAADIHLRTSNRFDPLRTRYASDEVEERETKVLHNETSKAQEKWFSQQPKSYQMREGQAYDLVTGDNKDENLSTMYTREENKNWKHGSEIYEDFYQQRRDEQSRLEILRTNARASTFGYEKEHERGYDFLTNMPHRGEEGFSKPPPPNRAVRKPTLWEKLAAGGEAIDEEIQRALDNRLTSAALGTPEQAHDHAHLRKKQVLEKIAGKSKHLTKVFRMFDENFDGTINEQEFRRGLKLLGFEDFTEKEIKDVIHLIDTDGNGEISYEEFGDAFNDMASTGGILAGRAPTITGKFEKNHSIRSPFDVPIQEMPPMTGAQMRKLISNKVFQSGKQVSEIFAQFDRNRDRGVSIPELRDGLGRWGIYLRDADFETFVNEIDANHSGYVDFVEFSNYVKPFTADKCMLEADLKKREEQRKKMNEKLLKEMQEMNTSSIEPTMDEKERLLVKKLLTSGHSTADIFLRYDVSHSGSLSYSEFEKAIASAGLVFKGDDFSKLVRRWDPDNSGAIDYREFVNRIKMVDAGKAGTDIDAWAKPKMPTQKRGVRTRGPSPAPVQPVTGPAPPASERPSSRQSVESLHATRSDMAQGQDPTRPVKLNIRPHSSRRND